MGFLSPSAQLPMLSTRRADSVSIRTPAKVNLFLEVLARRPDGYHEIATLMVAVSLFDTLTFEEQASEEVVLQCNRTDLSTGPDNLVCRAATLLRQRTGCRRGARIRLKKRIPMAAGLAGGSSDAAATLSGLNQLWGLDLSPSQLAQWSAELGSDVTFFLTAPVAWCTGRGEIVTPLSMGRRLWLVLVRPPVELSTAAVYRKVTVPAPPQTGDEIRQAVTNGDVEEIGRRLHNRLQPVAEQLCPEVAALRRRLEELKPVGQLMSGSGASLFALCRNRAEADRLARGLRQGEGQESPPEVFIVRSCV